MGLIKSCDAPSSLSRFSLNDIERHAKSILLRAQQQAEQLLAVAQAEAETLRQQGYERGLVDGQRDGLAQGTEQGRQAGQTLALNEHRAQLQNAMTALTNAMTSLEASRGDLESVALAEVIKLSVGIARRVTKRQGIIDPEVLSANLTDAMKLVIDSTDVRIAIHPSQRATLDAALPQLRLQWPKLRHLHVIDDATLEPGGCRVFTEHGKVDAELAGQLDRIARELIPVPEDA